MKTTHVSYNNYLYLTLALIGLSGMANSAEQSNDVRCGRLFDYTASASPIMKSTGWYSVNDNVMGGRSLGSFDFTDNALRFKGEINTNGGGFASIRHDIASPLFAKADRLLFSVQTDGRDYSVNIRDQQSAASRISHRASLTTSSSKTFQTVEVLFSDLVPTFRGRIVASQQFIPSDVLSLSIMLSDGIDGQFGLNIAWIDVCHSTQ